MKTVSLSARKSLDLPLSVNIKSVATAIAVIAAIGSFVAILLDSDFFQYLCATVALASVYTLERINPENPEGGEL